MIITPASIQDLMTGFNNNYQHGLGSAKPKWSAVATLVPSSSKSNTYGWLGQFPRFREWVGDRVINDMATQGYVITNKHWESTVGVSRDDIEDDNIGIYAPMFDEMGRAVTAHPDELVFPLLKDGFSQICYDGQYFFDTDHSVNDQVDGQGAATSTSNVLVDGGYTGEPWFLLDTTRAIKPVIYQQRKKPIFTHMVKDTDENVFTSNTFMFGIDCRDNVGFSFWQLAFGAQATLNFDNVWAAYNAMRGFKADGGRPLGIRPTTLVIGPTMEQQAAEVIDKQRLASGEDNTLYKKFDVVVADYL